MSGADPIFWLTVYPITKGAAPVRVDKRVTSIEYEDDEAKADKLKIIVDNYTLDNFDNPLWKTGNRIEVSWGYPGRMSPTRTCFIQKVTGSVLLTVEALSQEAAIMNKLVRPRTFENVKRSDVARKIAVEQGFDAAHQFIDDTKVVHQHVTQARMTDTQLLRDLARREGFEFYTDFDGFHFHRRKLGQRPIRKFVYFVGGSGDILTWNIENDIFAQKSGGVEMRGIDPLTKQPFSVKANPLATNDQTALAAEKTMLGISEIGENLGELAIPGAAASNVTNTTERTKEAAQRAADGFFGKAQMNAAELSMECRGDPLLVAKTIVEVQGIGKLISGNYYLKSITHKVGAGYQMAIKARRDGTNGGLGSAGIPAKGPVNTQKPPADAQGNGQPPDLLVVDGRTGQTFVDSVGRTQDAAPKGTAR